MNLVDSLQMLHAEAFSIPVASLEADATVYVKWIAKDPLTVSFDVISGTVIVSVTVEYIELASQNKIQHK